MATNTSSLKLFDEGIAQILAPLTDDIEDKTAETIIHFALQAVGSETVKLQSLIGAIYDKVTPRDNCSKKLLSKLSYIVPKPIGATSRTTQGNSVVEDAELARLPLLQKCQTEYDLGRENPDWPTRPVKVVLTLWFIDRQSFDKSLRHILKDMAESKHLFERQNLKQFVRLCEICGPILDQDGEDDDLTECMNKVWVRAASEPVDKKLLVAGLVSTRKNVWNTELQAELQVHGPSESELEVEVKVGQD